MSDIPEPFLAEDFTHVADSLIAGSIDPNDFGAILLAALRLAPVGLAAVAYHDCPDNPGSIGLRLAWERVRTTVREWRAANGD